MSIREIRDRKRECVRKQIYERAAIFRDQEMAFISHESRVKKINEILKKINESFN